MPLRVSSRVLRPRRGGVMRLNHGEAHDLRAVKEHRAAAAGRWQAVAFPSAAALFCLMAGGGRTGAVGGPYRVARSSSGPRHGSQLVSTKSLDEVHTRRTTRIGVPQVGQRATRGGGVRGGGWVLQGCPCPISRRIVTRWTAQLAWRKPKWRTC